MYVTKAKRILLKRKAVYEDRLLGLDKKLGDGEISKDDYKKLMAVYELILKELMLIENEL